MAHSEYIVSKTPGGELSPPERPRAFKTGLDVLNHTPVSSLLDSHLRLVKGYTKDPVLDGFRLLIENKILSIPLYDVERHSYVGFMDIIDVTHHILSSLSHDELNAGFGAWQKKFSSVHNKDVMDLSHRDPWMGVDSSASLQATVNFLLHHKVHRIPIIDGDGELASVLSQSRVVSYLARYIDLFDWAKKTVGELKLGYRQVVVVSNMMVTKDAFKTMRDAGVSGVGVVNEANRIVGVLSVSDMRHVGYTEHMFERFYLTVEDFLAIVRSSRLDIPHVVVATPKTTVAQLSELFTKYKMHRVFVVESEESMNLLGIISLHDYLMLFGRSFH